MTLESLVGTGPSDPAHNEPLDAHAIVVRMNKILTTDDIEIRLGREDSFVEFDHRCSVENALARAHSQLASAIALAPRSQFTATP